MQLTGAVITLGSLATLASGSAIDALNNAMVRREFVFPASVPLAKRAVTGAEYQCHANCGYTILNADTDGYCDGSDWKDLLSACLACANTYDLWADYGSGVETAAEACGLSAVPSGSSGSASTTAAAVETTSAIAQTTAAAAATTSAAETKAAETSAAAETKAEETAAASETVAVVTTASAVGTPTGSNSTSSTPTSSVVQAGAADFAISNVLVAGAALVAVAGLM